MLSWRVPPPSAVAVGAFYVALMVWVVAQRGGWWRVGTVAGGATMLAVIWVGLAPAGWPSRMVGLPEFEGSAPASRPTLASVFLDVGQGDATLLLFPSGDAWLIDAGGMPGPSSVDVGARIVVPALWALGVRSLDVLVVTHPDPDHAGGAPAAIADLRPRAVWEGVPVDGHPVRRRIRDSARLMAAVWRRVVRGERVDVGGATVSVLHPPHPDWERRRARNDDSITLLVSFGRVRVVLPADIGSGVERELLRDVTGDRDAVTVLKVGHHGSAGSTSPAFLDAVRPSLAIVSAGRFNRFGHPAAVVVDRLRAAGASVLTTARAGALAVLTDGREVRGFRWDGRQWVGIWRATAARAADASTPTRERS
jgi:competence protein ComEC